MPLLSSQWQDNIPGIPQTPHFHLNLKKIALKIIITKNAYEIESA